VKQIWRPLQSFGCLYHDCNGSSHY